MQLSNSVLEGATAHLSPSTQLPGQHDTRFSFDIQMVDIIAISRDDGKKSELI